MYFVITAIQVLSGLVFAVYTKIISFFILIRELFSEPVLDKEPH